MVVGWEAGRLWAEKRREGGLHMPQDPRSSWLLWAGGKESYLCCSLSQLTLWHPRLGLTHCKPLGCVFGSISSPVASFKKHIFEGGRGGGAVISLKVSGAGGHLGLSGPVGVIRFFFLTLVYPDGFPVLRKTHLPLSTFGSGFLFIFSSFPYELNPQRSQFLGWIQRIWKWLWGWVGLGSKV